MLTEFAEIVGIPLGSIELGFVLPAGKIVPSPAVTGIALGATDAVVRSSPLMLLGDRGVAHT